MVYKKYIKRGRKVHGPYYYHNVKMTGKVTTYYLGRTEEDARKHPLHPSNRSKKLSKNPVVMIGFFILLAAVLFNFVFLLQIGLK